MRISSTGADQLNEVILVNHEYNLLGAHRLTGIASLLTHHLLKVEAGLSKLKLRLGVDA